MEIAPNMAPSHKHHESWDSLSSALAHLEVSFSQDSCYGSDEVSVSSNNTAPLQSSVSTCIANREEPSLHPFLKSILKKPSTDLDEEDADEDTASESGYGSDDVGLDYDALSDEDENDEDDMSDFSVWDEETADDVPETRQDHTDSFDDSFIGFEASVRFDPQIQYIDTPDTELSGDESGSHTEMTAHEMMLLAQQSGSLQCSWQSDVEESDEECDIDREAVFRSNAPQLEDFSRDAVDVDQRLFIAYMNGIHGIADSNYKTYLRAQADNIRLGHETEAMHPDDPPCMYLDLVLNHVIGVFRNLLAADELDDLIALRKEDSTDSAVSSDSNEGESSNLNPHQALLDKIEHFLLDRLTNGCVDVLPDELSFFAGGIAHALGTQDLPALV